LDVKKQFAEEQIIGFLREAELRRRHGFSEASYGLWRRKFGGMKVSDDKRLKGPMRRWRLCRGVMGRTGTHSGATGQHQRVAQAARTDNGKEFCSRAMLTWAHPRVIVEAGAGNTTRKDQRSHWVV
jgi:hypothetical protein